MALRFSYIVALAVAVAFSSAPDIAAARSGGSHKSSPGGAHPGGAHGVKGYTKMDGTKVAPHRATNPDGTKRNNWSSKGNTNPDTGKSGTKEPGK